MPDKISRRDLAKLAAGAAVASVLPASEAQEPAKPDERAPEIEAELAQIERKLGIKLEGEARKLTETAIRGNLGASSARWNTKLPENSEPCFTFHASPRERKAL